MKQRYAEGSVLLYPERSHPLRAPGDTRPPPGYCNQLIENKLIPSLKHQIDEMNVCSMRVNTWRYVTCKVQWCGVPALCVSAVDVFRAAEFLHSSQTALLGGIQQGGVSTQQVLDVRVSVLHHVQSHVAITVLLRWVSAVLKREYICECKRAVLRS